MRVEVLAQPEAIIAEVMNISQKGFFLRADASTPMDVLRLSTSLSSQRPLFLVLHFRGDTEPAKARGLVAWKSDLGIGINFEDPPERLRDFISDLQDAEASAPLLSQIESSRIELA